GSPTDPVEPNNVTASNNAGLTSSATSFTVTPDSIVPTGQSVALSGGPYYTSLSVALTSSDGSDTGSGLDTSTRVHERDDGTLSNGSCISFAGTWATTVSSPADPDEPNNVTAQHTAGLSSNAASFTVTPDSSLPSSSIQCNSAACSAGWYTSSPVSVTLSASDTGSGLSQTKYTTDGTDPTL